VCAIPLSENLPTIAIGIVQHLEHHRLHCYTLQERRVVLILVTSVSYLFCIIKCSGDQLPALHSKQRLDFLEH